MYSNVMLRPQAGQVALSVGVTSLIACLWTQLLVTALMRVNCVVAVSGCKDINYRPQSWPRLTGAKGHG
jgi:hypothetical protein